MLFKPVRILCAILCSVSACNSRSNVIRHSHVNTLKTNEKCNEGDAVTPLWLTGQTCFIQLRHYKLTRGFVTKLTDVTINQIIPCIMQGPYERGI